MWDVAIDLESRFTNDRSAHGALHLTVSHRIEHSCFLSVWYKACACSDPGPGPRKWDSLKIKPPTHQSYILTYYCYDAPHPNRSLLSTWSAMYVCTWMVH
jgi:hypothetical protein